MTLLTLLRGDGSGPGPDPDPELTFATVTTPSLPAWDDAIRGSYQLATRATLLQNGEPTITLPITDGSVSLDANAATRGRCDVTVAFDSDDSLVPLEATDPLAPYGNEIQLERGIRFDDGTELLVALGIFGIYDTDVDDTGDRVRIGVAGFDRSKKVIDARFEEPYQIASGTNVGTAILSIVQSAYPGVVYDLTATALTTPTVYAEAQDDRWALAQKLANDIGMRLYFDGGGVLRMRPVTQPTSGSPAWTIAEGDNLLQVNRRWSREGAYNVWIVTGEATSEAAPARGTAEDNNPLSPTYSYGPFGRVPGFYVSSFITTDAQAADTAAAMLARQLGTTQQVSFGAIVNPRLQPDDIVQVTRERLGMNENFAIDQITIPLSAEGSMSATTRATLVYA